MGRAISEIMRSLDGRAPTQEEMDLIFEVSPTLGFTIWQHFAAAWILSDAKEWIEKNSALWAEVVEGRHLVGFGTTHLPYNRPGDAHIKEGRLFGRVPWASGFEAFQSYLLGCRNGSEVVLIRMPFPSKTHEGQWEKGMRFHCLQLAALNGTSSISLELDNVGFKEEDVVGRFKNWPPHPSDTSFIRYIHPEFGMLTAILSDVRERLQNYTGSRKSKFQDGFSRLEKRTKALFERRAQYISNQNPGPNEEDDLHFELCKLARDGVRFLTLLSAGSSLSQKSVVHRRHLELILLDARASSEYLFDRKLTEC